MPTLPPPQPYKPQQRPRPVPSKATGQLLHKRRSLIYAVGISIIAVSGALFGSQLKTKYQASQVESARLEQSAALQDTQAVGGAPGRGGAPIGTAIQGEAEMNERARRQREIDRRIEGLQGKRAMLVHEKGALEGKIEGLRERERERAEREEARRRADVR